MAERALFLSIARRCASRGEDRRAIVTILNALCHQPKFIDTHPETLTLLAELMVPGFEAELNRLQALYPPFGVRLFAEFDALGRDDIQQELAASFSAYCVERMKEAQCHDTGTMAEDNMPRAPYATRPCARTIPKGTCQAPQDAVSIARTFDVSLSDAFLDQAALTSSGQRRAMNRSTRSESGRRFERLCPDKCTSAAEATFVDDPTQRIILDFDKRLTTTACRSLWQASSLTPYRTFTEELKDFRESTTSSQTHVSISRNTSPLEVVAETTYALTDTPSIAPYAARHPLRFSVRGLPLALSVIVCALLAFGAIAWHTAGAEFERHAVRGIGEAYLAAADSGQQDPVSFAEDTRSFGDLQGYRAFLDEWQAIHFVSDHPCANLDSSSLSSPATVAAHVMHLTHEGRLWEAQRALDEAPSETWIRHGYFRDWAHAQIAEAMGDALMAASHYERLLASPLRPFALSRLGVLALEYNHLEIVSAFLSQATGPLPTLAHCVRTILAHDEIPHAAPSTEILNFAPPYNAYCALADYFEGHAAGKPMSNQHLSALASVKLTGLAERHRQEALIDGYLSRGATQHAMQAYADLDLPHPLGEKIRRRLLKHATQTGDWSIVSNLLNIDVPGMNYLEAARYIDLKQTNVSDHWSSAILMIEPKKPNSKPSSPYLDALDMAYHAAYAGDFTHALSLVRDLRSLHPAHWEPLFLQAMILSQMGEGLEAAKILESRLPANDATAPLIVLANLYRARANQPLHPSWIILPYLHFADPALEGARCEVFWRHTRSAWATLCLSNAVRQPHVAKNTWWMFHDITLSKRTSTELSKIDSGAMSLFGYHLIWAQRRMAEGATQEAAEGYKRAITFDPTTSTPDVVAAMAHLYLDRGRRYEGSRFFEQFAKNMSSMTLSNEVQGAIHYWAAILYNPAAAHPSALSHLMKAKDKLGETRPILKALIQYYDKKEKPLQVRQWKQRLAQLEDPS